MERAVILGGGESGTGSAILASVKGYETFLSDRGSLAQKYKEMLEQYGIAYEEGVHTPEKILNACHGKGYTCNFRNRVCWQV